MSQNLPGHSINKTRAIQCSDSTIILNPGLSPLEIPELLEIILGYLAGRGIVSAARVCRTWSEPALDQIWRTMDSLVPLFTLIGPMYWYFCSEWGFRDYIGNSDWSRYAVYARRIREVNIRDYDRKKRVSIQAMRTMLAHLPSHLHLPLPTSIHLMTTASAPATLLELPLISQSLRKLSLSQFCSQERHVSQDFATCLPGILQAASGLHDSCLQELRVFCFASNSAFIEAFDACLIKHRRHIARLTAKFPFDGRVWASIFSLPALQTLDIAPLNVGTSTSGMSVDLIPMVQDLVEMQPLLKELRLELSFALQGDPSNSPYSRIIHTLMGLRNLEILILHISPLLNLSESDVRAMGASWPKMRILILRRTRNGSTPEVEPENELSLLPFFIQSLPRLKYLHVPFVCNTALEAPQESLPASALRSLSLGKCLKPMVTQKEVVAYLAAVLPRHTRLHHWHTFGESMSFWDGVACDLDSTWRATQQTDL